MPIDDNKLNLVLVEMKKTLLNQDGFTTDPIRSQRFIKKLHSYCVYELKRIGLPEELIIKEFKIHGFKRQKNVDIAIVPKNVGPVMAIFIKSQSKSIAKNTHNELENLSGDVINVHQKYNSLVVGNLYLLPTETIIGEKEKPNIKKYIENFNRMNLRKNISNDFDKFEHTAFLIIDFTKNPPEIVKDKPTKDSGLRIENFFDKIYKTFKQRNYTLNLHKK